MLFSRDEPKSLDTSSAMQLSALQPIAEQDISCVPVHLISPRQSVEYELCNHDLSLLPSRPDYRTLCPDTNSVVNQRPQQDVGQQLPRWLLRAIWCREYWQRLRQQPKANHHAQRADCVLRRFWHDLWNLGKSGPPKTRPAHNRICRLPLPVHAAELVTIHNQGRPYLLQQPQLYPTLKSAVSQAFVRKLFGQMIPLTSRSHPENDGIESSSGVDTFSARVFGWVAGFYNWFYFVPQFVRYSPNRWQCFDIFSFFGHPCSLSIELHRWLSAKLSVLR